jgi:ribose transport system substrate-binding protein
LNTQLFACVFTQGGLSVLTAKGMEMTREILRISFLATAVIAAGTLPVMADAASDGLAKAKQELAVYTQKPVFKAPGEAFDAKACANGKKQLSIPNSSTNPFLKGIIDREKKAGAEIGLQVKEWENQPMGSGDGVRYPR